MEVHIQSFQQAYNLGVVQFSTDFKDSLKYISSESAIKRKCIEVREVHESGSVNHLQVINTSEDCVFMMDGDILVGAKQNRVLNTSVYISPKSSTVIPVSCVEQGRWRYQSSTFTSGSYTAPAFLRSAKSSTVHANLKSYNMPASDQGEMWNRVSEYQLASSVSSPTSSLSDVFDTRANDFEAFTASFTPAPGANGCAIFLEKDILSLDVFNRGDVYGEYFVKLLRGTAAEAFYMKKKRGTLKETEAVFKTQDFFDRYEELPFESFPGVGAGREERFRGEQSTGFALTVDGVVVHLTSLRLKM